MSNSNKLIVLALIFMTSSALADEKSINKPIGNFYIVKNLEYIACSTLIRLSVKLGKMDTKCDSELIDSVNAAYLPALKSAGKNKKLTNLLEQYRDALIDASASLQPATNERVVHYEDRLVESELVLIKIAKRIEVEM